MNLTSYVEIVGPGFGDYNERILEEYRKDLQAGYAPMPEFGFYARWRVE
jgi:hypothetical protein